MGIRQKCQCSFQAKKKKSVGGKTWKALQWQEKRDQTFWLRSHLSFLLITYSARNLDCSGEKTDCSPPLILTCLSLPSMLFQLDTWFDMADFSFSISVVIDKIWP
uniref:Uncharacterized protein n=1 Tax=Micrurus spixii TaxID=129469 RepID=A0A2D4MYB7_9SAUR